MQKDWKIHLCIEGQGEAQVGSILTRYGRTYANSRYFSPRGTTIGQRNLLEGTDVNIYQEFEVLKPIPGRVGPIAGEDGLPTGGTQFRSSIPAGALGDGEFIKPIDPTDVDVSLFDIF